MSEDFFKCQGLLTHEKTKIRVYYKNSWVIYMVFCKIYVFIYIWLTVLQWYQKEQKCLKRVTTENRICTGFDVQFYYWL